MKVVVKNRHHYYCHHRRRCLQLLFLMLYRSSIAFLAAQANDNLESAQETKTDQTM